MDVSRADLVREAAMLLLGMIADGTLDDLGAVGRQPSTGGPPLTRGEIRVLRLLPTNLTATEIAGTLHVSVNTVKTHQRHVYEKLAVRRRGHAVERARALGLLAPYAPALTVQPPGVLSGATYGGGGRQALT
jgi:ATP/maltotriose-dependent transcriptional regulator MalT